MKRIAMLFVLALLSGCATRHAKHVDYQESYVVGGSGYYTRDVEIRRNYGVESRAPIVHAPQRFSAPHGASAQKPPQARPNQGRAPAREDRSASHSKTNKGAPAAASRLTPSASGAPSVSRMRAASTPQSGKNTARPASRPGSGTRQSGSAPAGGRNRMAR